MSTATLPVPVTGTTVFSPTASIFLHENRCRALLGLPENKKPKHTAKPTAGQYKFWIPDLSLNDLVEKLKEAGLETVEQMHLKDRDFAKKLLPEGYLTIAVSPPRRHPDGPYRKPEQLKRHEALASVAQMYAGALMMFLAEVQLLNENLWLATADECKKQTVCMMTTESGIILDLHNEHEIAPASHATAVYFPEQS